MTRQKNTGESPRKRDLSLSTYRRLSEFRHQVRCFLRFSEDAARAHGIEPQQHQLLLAIKGLPKGKSPTIGELARRLQIKHHSTVDLINRLEKSGRILREPGADDHREVLIRLTPQGERTLRELSVEHQIELTKIGPKLMRALSGAIRLARRIRPGRERGA
ncbi:MAG TPA: MarR family transcriptional regulator [Bryobacteraceae bacterium]|nr:MarR family transcriptional regulator [Bryobacteraceae bacterium]